MGLFSSKSKTISTTTNQFTDARTYDIDNRKYAQEIDLARGSSLVSNFGAGSTFNVTDNQAQGTLNSAMAQLFDAARGQREMAADALTQSHRARLTSSESAVDKLIGYTPIILVVGGVLWYVSSR